MRPNNDAAHRAGFVGVFYSVVALCSIAADIIISEWRLFGQFRAAHFYGTSSNFPLFMFSTIQMASKITYVNTHM